MRGRSWDESAAHQAGEDVLSDEEQQQLEEAIEREQELAFELSRERDWED